MIRKLIIILVIIGAAWNLVVSVPKINAAAIVHDPLNAIINGITAGSVTSITVKEYILDTIARGIARGLLNAATSGIIKKIQGGGRDGGPAFVQNWRNYQTDSQYRGENVFRSILAGTKLCNYFQKDIKNLFGANKKINAPGQNLRVNNFDPFTLRSNCTLPPSFNMASYQQDFAGNGGWNAWSRLLEPQNNYYGVLFDSLDEANQQRAIEESGDMNEALAGSGYTSIRDKKCAGTGAGAKCVFLGKVFTPGDLLGKAAASTIDNDLGWLVSSDEISEVIIALATAITNRMANLALADPDNDYKKADKADDSKTSGYLACINACSAADNLDCQKACAAAWGYNTPQSSTPFPTPPPGGGGTEPPADADTKHGNHAGEVAAAKDELIAEGRKFPDPNATDECFRFEIVERAVPKISGAGFLDKPSGNNCKGFAVDIIAFSDGYIYDVLSGGGDGSMPVWNATGCGPVGGNGTCPERYRAP